MTLAEYFERTGASKPEFAERCGVSRRTIYYWIDNEKKPSKQMQELIKEITLNLVTDFN